MAQALRLIGTHPVNLDELSPHGDEIDRAAGETRFAELSRELGELQELCYAAGTEALLVVLQGMDTSGKDGAIRSVFDAVNPQGVRVSSFKVPTPLELAHDFLWRIHQQTPAKGMFGIFNRSHYESVLVERVKDLVPEQVWSRRYDQINDFERLLTASDTIVVKFFLHISKGEQKERLLKREEDPEKSWKLSPNDWIERRWWPAYIAAYQDALNRCATPNAPWYVAPADRKWYRDLVIAEALLATLQPYRQRWLDSLTERGEDALAAVRAERSRES
ncbi:MAG: polyphosphate kinase 2 family protein [Chloroflexota bacterium]|nr:polyphosphate kinase 2 family protein [Chloroflexota bacterium]